MRRIILSLLIIAFAAGFAHAKDRRVVPAKNRTQAPEQISEARVALVIGNGAYKSSPLKNPVNDARAMADALKALGFTVDLKENVGLVAMKEAVTRFGRKLKEGGVGLFYYSGHGMQVKGENYLIPVDADIEDEEEVEYKTMDAGFPLAKMAAAHNRMNIVVLDACRNNPFMKTVRSGGAGLASMNAPAGTIVAYSTAPGAVASDGDGKNGLYTGELVREMSAPGVKLEDVFKRVRANVKTRSGGTQVSWESSSLEGDFYFSGGLAAKENAAPSDDSGAAPVVDANADLKAQLLRAKAQREEAEHDAEVAREREELEAQLELEKQKAADAKKPKSKPTQLARRFDSDAPEAEITNPTDGMAMVLIPAGEFWMGSEEGVGSSDEHPRHRVALDAYYIGKYEVTVAQYRRYCDATGKTMPDQTNATGDDHPVVNVSWNDAKAYCDWAGLRLPIEAEWEYAARGGTETTYIWGNGLDGACEYGNVLDNSYKNLHTDLTWDSFPCTDGYDYTAPVGSFKPNGYGVYDTTANVWEWCSDWYGDKYYGSSPKDNPKGPSSGEKRVFRGGSWSIWPDCVRNPYRLSLEPEVFSYTMGFRCAKGVRE